MTNPAKFCIIYSTYGKNHGKQSRSDRKHGVTFMKPMDKFKKFRDDYVIHQVEKAKLPDFEDDYFVRRRLTFYGRVQHVGFRLELEQMANRLGLTGWVKNLEDGGVQAEVQGYESRIRYLLKFMRSLKRIRIEKLENKPCSPKQNETEFKII